MANKWIEHIKKWAKDNNSTYGCALSNPKCKEDYKKSKEEPKQEWKPKGGEKVWIKVFSNWSSGKYIGYDVDKNVHLVREPKEGGGNLFTSPDILPYSAMPNETKQEALDLINANSRLWMQFQSGSQGISGKKTVNALTKFEELFIVQNEPEVEENIDNSDDDR